MLLLILLQYQWSATERACFQVKSISTNQQQKCSKGQAAGINILHFNSEALLQLGDALDSEKHIITKPMWRNITPGAYFISIYKPILILINQVLPPETRD